MANEEYILRTFPSPVLLAKECGNTGLLPFRKVNGHIHTPYSFSSFSGMDEIFRMAVDEEIKVLGINDFYVADGYEEFYANALTAGVFPLFNIEFIGLMKKEKELGIRINDPNNPGRIYFCGKGLRYPFSPGGNSEVFLKEVREESQKQMRAMIDKINALPEFSSSGTGLSYDEIKKKFARDLVRERHLAKAVRVVCSEKYGTGNELKDGYARLFGGNLLKSDIYNVAAVENEIRSKLLKAGGLAFVEEDDKSFPELDTVISVISDAGGIPCYPVLLDDAAGNYTEFERDKEALWNELTALGVGCIELIPGRNNHERLGEFVRFFDSKGFVITFGTEHNTPDLAPLTVAASGKTDLSDYLLETSWKGSCVIAAHQYLTAKGLEGFTDNTGRARLHMYDTFVQTGKYVIEHYLRETRK